MMFVMRSVDEGDEGGAKGDVCGVDVGVNSVGNSVKNSSGSGPSGSYIRHLRWEEM